MLLSNEAMKTKSVAHWTYLENVLRMVYEMGQSISIDWEEMEPLMKELYVSAMVHGFKHAMEDKG